VFERIKKFFVKDKAPSKQVDVYVEIKRLLGGKIPVSVTTFVATQTRDSSYNLQLEGLDGQFKEDVTILKEKVIEYLIYKLNLKNIPLNERIRIIKEAIKKQEDYIKSITNSGKAQPLQKDGESSPTQSTTKTDTAQVNILTEERTLQQFKVLLFCVQNEGTGSYEELTADGFRKMTFLYQDGMLYPYFIKAPVEGEEFLTLYPDIGSKRKFYKNTQDLIDAERREEMRNPLGNAFFNIMKVLFVVLFVLNMFWSYQLAKDKSTYMEVVDAGHYAQLNNMSQSLGAIARINTILINDAKQQLCEYDTSVVQDDVKTVDNSILNVVKQI